jgi:HAD superfamily phosphoserine phosphatase-like hydrolase
VPEKRYAHFSGFDLDHTLVGANSSARFGLFLFQRGLIPLKRMLYLVYCYSHHRFLKGSLEELHRSIFDAFFRGLPLKEIEEQVPHFLDSFLPKKCYRPLYQRLLQAQERQDFVCLMSSSPDFLIAPIAAHYGFDGWLATEYLTDEKGRFAKIGRLVDGEEKALFLRQMALKLHLSKEDTTAYSDSVLDLPFLLAAGRAVGVRPSKSLLQICRKRAWEIL